MTLSGSGPDEFLTRPALFCLAFGNLKRACYAVNLSRERIIFFARGKFTYDFACDSDDFS